MTKKNMFIDTHCHLTFEQYHDDLPMVLGNAKKVGVKQFIVPAVDTLSSRLAVELAQKHPGVVFAAIGFHPYEASHEPSINQLEKFFSSKLNPKPYPLNPIVAIGEIGLDYHLYKGEKAAGKKQVQKILFEEQLRLALKYNLPAIMHCRDGTSHVPAAFDGGAFEDFFDVLDGLPQRPRGVIHCFSGGIQEIRQACERNLYLGVDGNVTYSKQLALIVPHIPLDRMLLETDAPYLTPAPHRGQRNEPKYIPLIAQKIADLQQKSVPEIMETTTANGRLLFSI